MCPESWLMKWARLETRGVPGVMAHEVQSVSSIVRGVLRLADGRLFFSPAWRTSASDC